ncbi:MAG TPA: hypothetical protein PLV13_11500 [Ilumatobacteraceae bacterium]|nr:hypothetical protein [Ilumatobacteraceae bacterium]
MVECHECHNEMTTGVSCTVDVLHQRGRAIALAPFRARVAGGSARCGDCGVADGGFHHPGCDLQSCPACGRQLLSCGCRFDEFEDGEIDDDVYEDPECDDEVLGVDW